MTSAELVLQAGTIIDGRARCAANLRQPRQEGDDRPLVCLKPPGHDTDHPGVGRCSVHGGNTITQRQHSARVIGEQEVGKWGARRDISYPEAMLEVVQWKATEASFWQSKVDGLDDSDMTWGRTKSVGGGGFINREGVFVETGTETTEEAVPHIFIKQLHEAQRDLVAACTAAARVGVDAALVNLAQSRAGVWLGAMRRMMADPRVRVDGDSEQVIFDALKELQTP